MKAAPFDPYALRPGDVEEPPATVWRAITRLGPGMRSRASSPVSPVAIV